MSKQIYPDIERVEDTDMFDSNFPRTDKIYQHGETNLDQDFNENEPSEETVTRHIEPRQDRQIETMPDLLTRTDKSRVEVEINDFRPLSVRFGLQEEIILPLPRNESEMILPLRTEQPKEANQRTQAGTEDEDRINSRLSRKNQSSYGLRENPTPKTYPDFLIYEITTVRNALRNNNNAILIN